jgi:hypothetical protein
MTEKVNIYCASALCLRKYYVLSFTISQNGPALNVPTVAAIIVVLNLYRTVFLLVVIYQIALALLPRTFHFT